MANQNTGKNWQWYKEAVFYELNIRAYKDSNEDGIGDLRGAQEKLPYLRDLGVDCVWLLPIYPSPLKDDGYDISDYYDVHPDYGTLQDFKEFVARAHQLGLRVITDLVLNHTSDQHLWFQQARSDPDSPYREYYVWSDTDQKYSDARIIFLDTETSNWTWDEQAGQFFWHRFYSSQPDLNFDNPAVQEEMFRIMDFWLDLGVDGFRADAVPYLFEREGTNCENLPETHEYLKRLRAYLDEKYPDRILLCEANQWPEDVRPYFGDGDEFHMGFHFPVMPRIFMSLRRGDHTPLKWIIDRTPEIPANCQWCIFLRNHDELTLEMVTEEERQWMWEQYAPEPRMRLNLGIRRRLAPLLDNDRRKIILANSLLFTLPGSPIIYYGDEIGMGDNIWLFDRNGVRTPMQWSAGQNAAFSTVEPAKLYAPVIAEKPYDPAHVNVELAREDPDSLWHQLQRFITIRKQTKTFGWGGFDWITLANPGIAAYWRTHEDEHIAVFNNLTAENQLIDLRWQQLAGAVLQDMISGDTYTLSQNGTVQLVLPPYGYYWLQVR